MTKQVKMKPSIRLIVVVIIISLVVTVLFSLLSLYLDRVVSSPMFIDSTDGRPDVAMTLARIISSDLANIGRYVVEVGVVILVIQLVRRTLSR